jgi:hypothetical protein
MRRIGSGQLPAAASRTGHWSVRFDRLSVHYVLSAHSVPSTHSKLANAIANRV